MHDENQAERSLPAGMEMVIVNPSPPEGWVDIGVARVAGIGGILREPGSGVVFDAVRLGVKNIEDVADQIVAAMRFQPQLRMRAE
jgi:hypothetical protein